jgi:hypothetical protein
MKAFVWVEITTLERILFCTASDKEIPRGGLDGK